MTAAGDRYDVVVVGGGQAGLALGYFLARDGRRFKILEAADAPAAEWRKRWDSLKLFTPVRYDSLPGLPFPGELDANPSRDEVVEYLARYAEHFSLPVQFNSEVLAVRGGDDRGFVVELRDRAYAADQVVIATGPFQTPRVPAIAEQLDASLVQMHSADYRGLADVPGGPVLVVGGGNTGYQIAEELAAVHEVHLSVGSRQTPLPQRLLGRDLFRYLEAGRFMRVTVHSRLGQRLQYRETLIGSSPRAARRRRSPRTFRRPSATPTVRSERPAATSGDVCSALQAGLTPASGQCARSRALLQGPVCLALTKMDQRPDPSFLADRPPPEGGRFEQLSLGQLPMVCGARHRCRRAGTTSRDSRSIDSSAVSTGIPLQNGRKRK